MKIPNSERFPQISHPSQPVLLTPSPADVVHVGEFEHGVLVVDGDVSNDVLVQVIAHHDGDGHNFAPLDRVRKVASHDERLGDLDLPRPRGKPQTVQRVQGESRDGPRVQGAGDLASDRGLAIGSNVSC